MNITSIDFKTGKKFYDVQTDTGKALVYDYVNNDIMKITYIKGKRFWSCTDDRTRLYIALEGPKSREWICSNKIIKIKPASDIEKEYFFKNLENIKVKVNLHSRKYPKPLFKIFDDITNDDYHSTIFKMKNLLIEKYNTDICSLKSYRRINKEGFIYYDYECNLHTFNCKDIDEKDCDKTRLKYFEKVISPNKETIVKIREFSEHEHDYFVMFKKYLIDNEILPPLLIDT